MTVYRNEAGQRLQMRRSDAKQDGLFPCRLAKSTHGQLLNRTQPPVGDTEAVSGSPRAEISLLNQGNPEPPEGRIPGNSGAMDPSTDDQKVELLAFQSAYITSHQVSRLLLGQVRMSAFNVQRDDFNFGEEHRIFGVTLRTESSPPVP